MYGLLSKLLISGKLKFKQGEIIFTGQPMTLFPLRTLKEMTIDAMKNGNKGIRQLYFYGWHYGYTTTLSYMRTFKLKKFEETFKLIMDVSSLLGFGDYQTTDFKQRQFSRFKNIKNPFGLLFYKTDKNVCHFIRGANAGGGTALHNVIMNDIELECTANNNKYCLFMNIINSVVKKKYPDAVKEQLDLDWLFKKQINIIKKSGEDPDKYLEENQKKKKIYY